MDIINLDTIGKCDKNAINEGDIHDKGNIDPIDERDIHTGTVVKLRSRDEGCTMVSSFIQHPVGSCNWAPLQV